jgi:hypothetical protein
MRCASGIPFVRAVDGRARSLSAAGAVRTLSQGADHTRSNEVFAARTVELSRDEVLGLTMVETRMTLEVESDVVATNRLDLDEAAPLGNLHVGAAPPDPAR